MVAAASEKLKVFEVDSFEEKINNCQALRVIQNQIKNFDSFCKCGDLYQDTKAFNNLTVNGLLKLEVKIDQRAFNSKNDFLVFCSSLESVQTLEKVEITLSNPKT